MATLRIATAQPLLFPSYLFRRSTTNYVLELPITKNEDGTTSIFEHLCGHGVLVLLVFGSNLEFQNSSKIDFAFNAL